MYRNKNLFISASFLLGFASIISQVILFRELLSVFYGNELCLGILLCVWLLWVGLGSYSGNFISNSKLRFLTDLSLWYFLLALFSVLTIAGIRYSRIILNVLPGELIGFIPMFGFTLFILAPLCLILGILFVLNSTGWQFSSKQELLVTRVYIWESLGAGAGGFLCSLLFIPFLSNFSIQSWLFILLFFFSSLLIKVWYRRAIVIFLIFSGMLFFKLGRVDNHLEKLTSNKLWRGQNLVKSVDSKYGNIAVLRTAEQISFYENGLILFSYPDEFSSEEAVLFTIANHPDPEKMLLIGGGLGGTLTQALKCNNLQIDYVELDPKIVELGKVFLPQIEVNSLNDNRVRIEYKDGRLLVREIYEKSKKDYDIIVLNLPDPYNAQLNRFYTVEFFEMVKGLLSLNGIFSFRASSAENYLNPEQALYISSLQRTLQSCFEKIIIIPGANNIFLASQSANLTDDWEQITENLKNKNIPTTFLNEHFLSNRLSAERKEYLHNTINSFKGEINYDLRPISYYYNTILWSAQVKSPGKRLFEYLSRLDSVWYFVFALLLSFSCIFLILKKGSILPGLSMYAIFLAGFTSIGFEISLLIIYQVIYGYIYSQVGIFLTLFMLGIFSGALFISSKSTKADFRTLRQLQLLQVILVFLTLIIIIFLLKVYFGPGILQIILGSMIFLSGFTGGALFTSGNQIYLESKGQKKAGSCYAIDLFGSAISAILTSAFLLPLLGIPQTILLLLLLNLIFLGFICFFMARLRNKVL